MLRHVAMDPGHSSQKPSLSFLAPLTWNLVIALNTFVPVSGQGDGAEQNKERFIRTGSFQDLEARPSVYVRPLTARAAGIAPVDKEGDFSCSVCR